MSINTPIEKLASGLILIGMGFAMFWFISSRKKKDSEELNHYDLDIYIVSTAMMLAGLWLVYLGIRDYWMMNY